MVPKKHTMKNKVTVHTLREMKDRGKKITALTCYNYYLSKIMNRAGIDVLLVGDSLGMVELGYDTTLPVTLADMLTHLKAVKRGNERALLVADMPYLSYNFSRKETIRNAGSLMKAGAEAVKVEGGRITVQTVRDLLEHQIPVMGHLGLTPQGINQFGGYRVQGKKSYEKSALIREAEKLQTAGVFALVLECVTEDLAAEITRQMEIPVIGIGAGRYCDGQILVTNDILGLYTGHTPRFVKQYAHLEPVMHRAIAQYCADVKKKKYPAKKHVYR